MCEFCENENYLLNYKDMIIEIEDGILIVRVYGTKNFAINLQINYCPMCGKKLGVE